MSIRLLLAGILLCASVLGRTTQVKPPPATIQNLEVQRIVDTMRGIWTGEMTANVPGFPRETFDWKMNCQTVAQSAGVSCTNTGKASIGSMAESCLLAFDPEGKSIHYMCVTSMGEVHDHKGKWIGANTIEFEPLRAGMMGQPITETLRWNFPDANTIDKTSEVRLADGSVMRFEFNGKRSKILTPVN